MKKNDFSLELAKAKNTFEAYLNEYLNSLTDIPEPVLGGIRYTLEGAGKRLRPCLALFCAEMFDLEKERVLPLCLAIEMIHSYSLVHDDLPCMDDDDLRRGRPTVHKVYGDGMAVLIGDALLNLSVEVLAESFDLIGPSFGEVMKVLYKNSGAKGMIAGQCVDLASEGEAKPTEEKVKYLHLHKTSCLIKAPIVCAALMAGVKNAEIKALEIFADNLGLAFQITDDILDVEGDIAVTGKKTGSDESKSKMTYPAVFGLQGAKELADMHINMAIDSLAGFERADNLISLTESIRNRRK